ncbi:hypothetical protein ACFSO7_09680 [Bacillus sp. CGMCC 1.16607]|uniref:hypothetical protein n=1 Tax=Bacillus sp. CGMCC 1.16607 TaxID=3351842 RepID=UPI003640A803
MIITFYLLNSWIMVALILFYQKRSKTLVRDTFFLLLLSVLINSHFYLGILETLELIKTTTNAKLYVSFLLYRSLIVPFFITYCLNIFYETQWKIVALAVFIAITLSLEKLGSHLKLYQFIKWNIFYSGIYYLFIFILLAILLKWFKKLENIS